QLAGVELVGLRHTRLDWQPRAKRLIHAFPRRETDLLQDRDGLRACIPEQTVMELSQGATADRHAVGRGGGVRRGAHIARQLRVWRVRGARVPPRRSVRYRASSPFRALSR